LTIGGPSARRAASPPPSASKRDRAAAPSSPAAGTRRPAQRVDLLGAWSLVSYTVTKPTGDIGHPLGTGAIGMLIYSPEGYMSAQLVNPHHSADDSHTIGADPITAAGQLAYSGPFTVDGTTGLVAHHLLVSSRTDWLHTNQHRHGILDGDRLILSFTGPDDAGQDRTNTLTWKRLNPQKPR
jgi:lipocalin-like protein